MRMLPVVGVVVVAAAADAVGGAAGGVVGEWLFCRVASSLSRPLSLVNKLEGPEALQVHQWEAQLGVRHQGPVGTLHNKTADLHLSSVGS